MLIVLLVVALLIIVMRYRLTEPFDQSALLTVKYMDPAEQDPKSTERAFHQSFPKDIYRHNYLRGQMFSTRFPGLSRQKYNSYNDQRSCVTQEALKPEFGARLNELPLHLRNWYHARIPKCLARTDDIYWPDTIIGNKYDGECPRGGCGSYLSDINMEPNRTGFVPAKYANHLGLNDLPNGYRRSDDILGFNPSDTLPAQYADRSKTSMEKYIAAANLRDAWNEKSPWMVVEPQVFDL